MKMMKQRNRITRKSSPKSFKGDMFFVIVSTLILLLSSASSFSPVSLCLSQRTFALRSSSSSLLSRLQVATSPNVEVDNMPELGNDGIYHVLNEAQHKSVLQHFKCFVIRKSSPSLDFCLSRALLEANSDKLVVMKVFAVSVFLSVQFKFLTELLNRFSTLKALVQSMQGTRTEV